MPSFQAYRHRVKGNRKACLEDGKSFYIDVQTMIPEVYNQIHTGIRRRQP
jgi:hypothetical protein